MAAPLSRAMRGAIPTPFYALPIAATHCSIAAEIRANDSLLEQYGGSA
jgi:hypothetical protein